MRFAPKDVGASIELELALDKIPFKFANDFYNQVVATTAMYGCTVKEKQLCTLAAKKCKSSVYVKMILYHVKTGTCNFEDIMDDITEVQRYSKKFGD